MPRNTLDILELTGVSRLKDITDCLIKVELNDEKHFAGVMETLTRMGIKSRTEDNTLYQTCHILSFGGCYYLAHFKHFYMLEGKHNGFFKEDILRLNRVAKFLEEWNLVKIVDPSQITEMAVVSRVKVIKHSEVKNWTLKSKYNVEVFKERFENY